MIGGELTDVIIQEFLLAFNGWQHHPDGCLLRMKRRLAAADAL